MSTVVTIAGSSQEGSSSDALLSHLTRRIARAGHAVTPIVLRELPWGARQAGRTGNDRITEAIETLQNADALVLVSHLDPASTSDLISNFLDLLPSFSLRGKSVLQLGTVEATAPVPAVERPLPPVPTRLAGDVAPGRLVQASHLRVFPDGGVLIDPAAAFPVADATGAFLATLGSSTPVAAPVSTHSRRVLAAAGAPDLTVRQVQVGDPELSPLLDELAVEYGTRYGRISPHTELTEVPASDFRPPDGAFLVLTEDGESVAGGAIRRYDDRTAEVKRVWTSSRHRRRGLAYRVMAELENRAAELGYQRIHLTTGPRQPEARALYLAAGYRPHFDVAADPESIGPLAFGKELTAGAGRVQPTWAEAQARHAVSAGAAR